MKVVFDHAEDVAHHIKTFWFRPEAPVRYQAGQFTEIHLPHDNPDQRGIKRWFTLSSSPSEDLLSITTKFTDSPSVKGQSFRSFRAGGGGSSFKQALARLKPDTPLQLADPLGDFVLPKDPSIPLTFVAGGMGITPMRSMVKWLLDTGEQRQVQLIYAVTEEDDMAFLPLFRQHGLKFTPVVKNPTADYEGMRGSLSADRILGLIKDGDDSLIYLSGPEPMIETFYKDLRIKGIPNERLVTDYFPGYRSF